MRLYHGSAVAVRKPSLRPGRPNADFGKGFYTTTNYEQAVRWAHIKQEQRQSLLGLYLARRRKTKSIEEQTGFATPVGAVDGNFSVKV